MRCSALVIWKKVQVLGLVLVVIIIVSLRGIFEAVLRVYDDIELTRNGGFTVCGRFYAFPERFADTERAAAFKAIAAFILRPVPEAISFAEIWQECGAGISSGVWCEVFRWFVEQRLFCPVEVFGKRTCLGYIPIGYV